MQFFIDNIFLIVMAIVSGGLLLWPSIRDRAGGERLDAVTATRLMNDEDPTLIDVRSPAEYDAGHLLRAKSIPLVDLPKRVSEIKGKNPCWWLMAMVPKPQRRAPLFDRRALSASTASRAALRRGGQRVCPW